MQEITADPDAPRSDDFLAAFRAHEPVVRRFVRTRLRGNLHEDDVVQQVFLTLWRRFHHFDTEVPPEWRSAWLVGVAKHVLSHHDRAEARRSLTGARHETRPPSVADEFERVDDRAVVVAALTALDRRDSEVLVLSNWAGLSSAELGEALGCSAATARKRLSRASERFSATVAEVGTSLPSRPAAGRALGGDSDPAIQATTAVLSMGETP